MASSGSTHELKTTQSPLEQKEELAPADFESVLKQVDKLIEEKYEKATLKLSGSFTPEQLSQLAEKMQKVEAEWKAAINFADYKTAHLENRYESDDKLSDFALEEMFDKFKADSLLWNLKIESTGDNPALVNFIVTQLQSKKIWTLDLKQCLSEKSMERIIYACKNSSLRAIYFNASKQIVSDAQAKVLHHCMASSQLIISNLPGKNISDETAEMFAITVAEGNNWLEMSDCPHFNERRSMEYYLRNPWEMYFGLWNRNFRADDIARLTLKLTNASELSLEFSLGKGPYTDPIWITFFTQVLGSTTNVTKLTISSDTKMSDEVLSAILTSFGFNKTIKALVIHRPLSAELVTTLVAAFKLNTILESFECSSQNTNHVKTIVESLSEHQALTTLNLNNSDCSGQGEVFKHLLTKTKTLQELYLVNTGSDDDTVAGLASALPDNTSLTKLCLTENQFTDTGLGLLSEALTKNQQIIHLSFYSYFGHCYTTAGVEHFVNCLQFNKSVIDTGFSWQTEDEKQIEPARLLLQSIEDRNKQLAHFRQLERREEECQPYAEIAIVLFQAYCQKHPNWGVLAMLENILSFLIPPSTAAHPRQVKRCTGLIQSNLLSKPFQWKTSVEEKTDWGRVTSYTIFKKWAGPTDTLKEFKSRPREMLLRKQ